ncbi:MAG: cytidine deaminase [Candidatus Eremiobacteraeota bacterium]|nr:cytidine deaminase [Candidatus Eremiobacteraeota bacterium]
MPPARSELLSAARDARERAYAPYSGFRVGAALETGSGAIVAGANVECASYALSMCAERSALYAAVANGERAFRALAIVGEPGALLAPCGACRQALFEFGGDLTIVREDREDVTLGALLPDAFGPRTLRTKEPAG